ncbi:hypothetical protein MMC26_003527 [Xylographa opegraphella]|nr:hypothetical protein [Xylographa opegraphella]
MYSLAAASKELSICLRCQLRLASRRTIDPRPARHPRFPQARVVHSGHRLRQEELADSYEETSAYFTDIPQSFDRYVGQDRVIFKPRARGRKWRRLRLGEQTVTLDMNVLGKPAQIRILPDRPKYREDYPLVDDPQGVPTDSTSPEELLRTMAEEDGALVPAVINDSIQGIYRKFAADWILGNTPTLARCREVAQELHDGFTAPQLLAYLKARTKNTSGLGTTNYDDLEERFLSKLCTRSAWFSGLSNFPEEAVLRLNPGIAVKRQDEFLIGFEPSRGKAKQTEKQRVIERILREAWKVRCKEEKAMEGELDIRLQAEHLRLLLNHKTDIFKQLSEQYNAKIDISRSQHIVRITGDYAICSDLAKLIYFMIEKIESVDIELPAATNVMRYKNSSTTTARGALSDSLYVQHIEKLTNTLIKATQSTRRNYVTKLRVYYIGPDTTDLEDVRRLVYQLLNPGKAYKCQVQYDPQDKLMVPIQAPVEVGPAIPWTERRTPWTRWRDANWVQNSKHKGRISKTSKSVLADGQPHSLAHEIGKFLSEDRPKLRDTDRVEGDHVYWQPYQKHMVSAVLGYITYPVLSRLAQANYIQARTYMSGKDQETRLRKAFLKTIDSRRTLVTSLPGSLEAFERLRGTDSQEFQDIRVRLQPSRTESGAEVELRSLPEVELRIRLNNQTKTAGVESVRLVRDERESDLLLPQEVADARFRAYTYFESKPQLDPKITDFLSGSNFNVWGENRLQTPSKLNLFVPRFALPESARGQVEAADGIDVEYVFTSLEYHSYMRTMYEGCRAYYNTVEAGKTGGRRTDLWLETPMVAPHSAYYLNRDFVQFLNTVRSIVSTMGQGAPAVVS